MKLLLFLLAAIISIQLYAQSTLSSSSNVPRPRDHLIKRQVVYKNPGNRGTQILWDFSKQDILNDDYELSYTSLGISSDTLIGTEHDTMYYYSMKGDSLLSLGYENSTTLINYRKPETLFVYPFMYGCSFTDYFDGMGYYCNRLGIHVQGKSTIIADAIGALILPGGDTLQNVLRVHTQKKMTEQTKPIVGNIIFQKDTFPFAVKRDSIEWHLSKDSTYLQLDIWRWYADGYRYPIFESIESSVYRLGKKHQYFTTSFYYPPYEQYYGLNFDSENVQKQELKNEEKQILNTISLQGWRNTYKEGNFLCSYSLDKENNLDIYYSLQTESEVQIILYDIVGRQLAIPVKALLSAGNYHCSLSLNNYSCGEYLLMIMSGNRKYTEKILIH